VQADPTTLSGKAVTAPSFALFDSAQPGWMYLIDPTTNPGTVLGSSAHPPLRR
jgi:hypothetical protein